MLPEHSALVRQATQVCDVTAHTGVVVRLEQSELRLHWTQKGLAQTFGLEHSELYMQAAQKLLVEQIGVLPEQFGKFDVH